MADYRLFKIMVVRHLGFVLLVLGPPRRVLGGLCDCAKFCCNRRSNFHSMQIFIFCTLSLKMHIHAPKIGVFEGFYPQNGEQYERDPQKAHPWAETRRMTHRSSKSVHRCSLGMSRRIKQKTKKTRNTCTFCGTWYLPHSRVHKSMIELCS